MLGETGLTPKKRRCKIRLCNEEDQQQLGRGQAERGGWDGCGSYCLVGAEPLLTESKLGQPDDRASLLLNAIN